MRARWNTSTSCSAPGKSYGSSGRSRSVPGRNRRVSPEWRRMSGGFSCIPRRVAVFETPLRRNRLDNARFSAIHFKTSDLPPLVEGYGEDGTRRARTERTARRIASVVGECRRSHEEYGCGVQRIQLEGGRICRAGAARNKFASATKKASTQRADS